MEFDLSGITAYCIQDTDEGCFLFNSHGFVMEAEQMLELAKKLRQTAVQKCIKKQLVEHNKNREIEIEKKWEEYRTKPKEQKPKKKGYVYLFECGGKYKIGYTIDVKRRIKELIADHLQSILLRSANKPIKHLIKSSFCTLN